MSVNLTDSPAGNCPQQERLYTGYAGSGNLSTDSGQDDFSVIFCFRFHKNQLQW